MKALLVALSLAVVSAGFVPTQADARRLGGGGTSGMQRSMPARTPPAALPAKPAQTAPAAAPATAGAAAAAPAAKRSWMGPIAGLAAGLGIAALMSHLGLGEAFGNILMMALLGLAAFFAIRFLMRRFGGAANRGPAMATPSGLNLRTGSADAPAPGQQPASPFGNLFGGNNASAAAGAGAGAAMGSANALAAVPASNAAPLPSDFDAAGFERIAKMIFIRMQAANDTADLDDLRAFTTPEMFASIKLDLQDRRGAFQQTDVVRVDAEVLEVAQESDRQIVSVRFHGLIREDKDGAAEPFDEVWHLVRPADGSREWAIAGIQQMA